MPCCARPKCSRTMSRKKKPDQYADIRRHFLRYHADQLGLPRLERTRKIEEKLEDDGSVTYSLQFYTHHLRYTYSPALIQNLRNNDCKVNLFD